VYEKYAMYTYKELKIFNFELLIVRLAIFDGIYLTVTFS